MHIGLSINPILYFFFEKGNICITIKQKLQHPKNEGAKDYIFTNQWKGTKKTLSKNLYSYTLPIKSTKSPTSHKNSAYTKKRTD